MDSDTTDTSPAAASTASSTNAPAGATGDTGTNTAAAASAAPNSNHGTNASSPTQERITRVRTLRSCISCRQRKVKCDKARPCGACVKSSFQCVFPEQRRRPPRPRQPDAALVGRLARLEGVIEELSKGTANASQLLAESHAPPYVAAGAGVGVGVGVGGGVVGLGGGRVEPVNGWASSEMAEMDTSLGQLLVSEDKSRYIAPGFWASVTEEVGSPAGRAGARGGGARRAPADRRVCRPDRPGTRGGGLQAAWVVCGVPGEPACMRACVLGLRGPVPASRPRRPLRRSPQRSAQLR